MASKKILYKAGLVIFILALLFLYKEFKPGDANFFPSCPFKKYTGLDCAGCGSQRAIHFLLNGDFGSAWSMNPLLIIALPYVIFGLLYSKIIKDQSLKSKLRNTIYGLKSTYIWLVVIIAFWIGRNLI